MFLVPAMLIVTLQGDDFSFGSPGILNALTNMTLFNLNTCRKCLNILTDLLSDRKLLMHKNGKCGGVKSIRPHFSVQ